MNTHTHTPTYSTCLQYKLDNFFDEWRQQQRKMKKKIEQKHTFD